MSRPSAKTAIYKKLAELAHALSHEHRLELLEHLSQSERSVEELSLRSGLSFANASRHLQILRNARLVEAQRRGKRVFYRLGGDAEVVTLIKALGRVGERNIAEIRSVMTDYFATRDALEPVSHPDLLSRVRDGLVTVLDVRPKDEFDAGHIPGALNIPVSELAERLAEIPVAREVVAYCRGPYCILSFDAVKNLRTAGYRARRLEDGYPEWKAAGHPVESSPRFID
jgi:ArsR family transcriptional regulator